MVVPPLFINPLLHVQTLAPGSLDEFSGHALIGPVCPYGTSPPAQYEPAGHIVGSVSPGFSI